MTDIKIPCVTFAFDSEIWHPLYGPENEKGEREIVGVIAKKYAERLQTMLDYADANMPEESR